MILIAQDGLVDQPTNAVAHRQRFGNRKLSEFLESYFGEIVDRVG